MHTELTFVPKIRKWLVKLDTSDSKYLAATPRTALLNMQ